MYLIRLTHVDSERGFQKLVELLFRLVHMNGKTAMYGTLQSLENNLFINS